ncbi:MAG: hypothetical protein ABTS16_23275 [Candidatus Accumulibacter phosphatis]|jgi:energy-converting hydrogenase Eha subunit G|uniref:Uncharacterized protein n=2 Tax=Candidatus Accumulibacter TaxID=327159 RepID=A0A080LSZ1_9PROT|nr:hypothetical protein [Candidatus Accumulibacter contiguus]KFB70690.1 MAG: hypothetical protein AW09_004206 [Candidatus Accumulibacter phosphatis]NMQ05858.1 hypothetical protein [Candidatus Accumulibacter contiguus]HRF13927.1 hypothetical protein [Candidatus Accumulibacter phosphatis]
MPDVQSQKSPEEAERDAQAMARFSAALTARAKSLEMLYDYTKFHIGVYLTLTASYITVASVKVVDHRGQPFEFLKTEHHLVGLAVLCFLLAGFAGGVIVSSITQFAGGSSKDFLETQIGPWNAKAIHFSGTTWAYIEHTSFWAGLLLAIASILVPRV